jgi:uncharacterized protein YjbI with pentapeptide repeats/CheY-like chemotaxis protein
MADIDWGAQRFLIVDHDLEFLAWADRVLRGMKSGQTRSTMVASGVMAAMTDMSPTAVLVDLQLDGNAIDLIRQVRDPDVSPNSMVPIVITTSTVDADQLRMACRVGIESIIRKPITEDSFIKRVRAAVRTPRRFIAAPDYFGPDRRREDLPFEGRDRRASKAVVTGARMEGEGTARERAMSDDEVAAARVRLASRNRDDVTPEEKERRDKTEKALLDAIDAHDEWVKSETRAGKRATLDRMDLYGVNLSNANLRKASLAGAILVDAKCRRTDFEDADLQQADLSFSDCSQANFSLAKLRRANISQAMLDKANFRNADLSGASLKKSTLKNANVEGANMNATDLRGADIRTTRGMTEAQLNKAIVSKTTLLPPNLTYVTETKDD